MKSDSRIKELNKVRVDLTKYKIKKTSFLWDKDAQSKVEKLLTPLLVILNMEIDLDYKEAEKKLYTFLREIHLKIKDKKNKKAQEFLVEIQRYSTSIDDQLDGITKHVNDLIKKGGISVVLQGLHIAQKEGAPIEEVYYRMDKNREPIEALTLNQIENHFIKIESDHKVKEIAQKAAWATFNHIPEQVQRGALAIVGADRRILLSESAFKEGVIRIAAVLAHEITEIYGINEYIWDHGQYISQNVRAITSDKWDELSNGQPHLAGEEIEKRILKKYKT